MISASMKVVLTYLILVYACYRYSPLIITHSVKLTVYSANEYTVGYFHES